MCSHSESDAMHTSIFDVFRQSDEVTSLSTKGRLVPAASSHWYAVSEISGHVVYGYRLTNITGILRTTVLQSSGRLV